MRRRALRAGPILKGAGAIGLASIGFAGAKLVGCGAVGCGASHPATSDARPSVIVPSHRPVAASAPRHRPRGGGREQLQAELQRELRRAGPGSSAYVLDLTTGQPVFSLRANVSRPPASVEKLYTSVALLTNLGSQAQLHTNVLGTGFLGAGGVWHGNLYLRGGGDPTFGSAAFNRVWELGYGASVGDLVSQLRARGIRSLTGRIIGDAWQFDARRGGPSTRFAPDLGDLGGELSALSFNHGESGGTARGAATPEALAAGELTLALQHAHVLARGAPQTGVTPRRARLLASVSSPPVSVLLRLMDVPSDDFYAEMLTKTLGTHASGSGSTAAGARAIADAVARFGIHPTVRDGSGLSRADRSSPLQVVDMLRAMWSTPPLGRILRAALPVLGVNGTTRRIAKGTLAQGRCVAKTGTLQNVSNLAGYCHGAGNQQLAFAVFIDGPSNESALPIEGAVASDIVRLNAALP